MAYKQNPGRGPMMKTGKGVPSALLQVDPTDPVKKKKDEKSGDKPFVPAGGDYNRSMTPAPKLDGKDATKDSYLKYLHKQNIAIDSTNNAARERTMAKIGWPKVGDKFGKRGVVKSIDSKTGDYSIRRPGNSTKNQMVSRKNVRRASTLKARGEGEIKLTPQGGSHYDKYPKGKVQVGGWTLGGGKK
jgi:hypothetical protein